MKLHCPHCGVKGSAEDSYSGRKVKCPKCQGVFEVTPDMAFELTEDSVLLSGLSTMPTEPPVASDEVEVPPVAKRDFWEDEEDERPVAGETEETVAIEEEHAEPEPEEAAPAEPEETLNWEDIASDIDVQPADEETEGGSGEDPDQSPTELSSLQDEFDKPAGDLADTEEDERKAHDEVVKDIWAEWEESPLLGPVDFGSPKQEIENDLTEAASIVESPEEETPEDEAQVVQETSEIELEPYGIEKEQCWQCGKKDNLGEPFIAKDGRLYCADCAPVGVMQEGGYSDKEQDFDDTPYTQASNIDETDIKDDAASIVPGKFSLGDAIREAWGKTKGAKSAIWAGSAIMYLVILVVVAGGMSLTRSLGSDMTNSSGIAINLLLQIIINVSSVLFTAGLLLMGIRKAAGERISWKMIFTGFSSAGKIVVATILQSLLVAVGLLLLLLPGIYLAVGYAMTIPLIVDKGLSPWQAMEMSRKAVHKVWWRVTGLFIVMAIIVAVSIIPLGIGLIWSWPMFIVLAGVVYGYLFGDERKEQ